MPPFQTVLARYLLPLSARSSCHRHLLPEDSSRHLVGPMEARGQSGPCTTGTLDRREPPSAEEALASFEPNPFAFREGGRIKTISAATISIHTVLGDSANGCGDSRCSHRSDQNPDRRRPRCSWLPSPSGRSHRTQNSQFPAGRHLADSRSPHRRSCMRTAE